MQFRQSNQTHKELDRELCLSDRIAFQNRLIDSVVPSAKSQIPRRGLIGTYMRKVQIVYHTFDPTLYETTAAMRLQYAIYLLGFFFIGGFFSAPLVLINAK
jgi:hypothetical protein